MKFSVTSSFVDPHEGPSDRILVEAVLEGKRDRFTLLVIRYQDGLFRYALGMVGDGDAAQDMVQDTLVTGFERLAECRNPDRFGSWIFRIVRNRCLDHLKEARRKNVPLDTELPHTNGITPEDDLERRLDGGDISRAVAELPELLREAFLLKYVQDRSYQEMAEMLDASESALKMRVKRARAQLAEALSASRSM